MLHIIVICNYMNTVKNYFNNLLGDEYYLCRLNTCCSKINCYGPFDNHLEAMKHSQISGYNKIRVKSGTHIQ